MQHTTEAEGRDVASPWPAEQKGLASVCCIIDATHLGSRPTFEGKGRRDVASVLQHITEAEGRDDASL
jgi:hypothetical protein